MRQVEELARAKINLALHVTGQRADGYHLLDSLVVFAQACDRLTFEAASQDRLTITGRFAASLPQDPASLDSNLVARARDALRLIARAAGADAPPVHIHLEKNLPVASGIGGGSADAAATLRGLVRLWEIGNFAIDLASIGLTLGADVPMCLESVPLVARGIGEDIRRLARFPALNLLLVNPLVEVSTPAIFRALTTKNNPPLDLPGDEASAERWLEALSQASNHLGPSAEKLAPEISTCLSALASTSPFFARMSGSGATCFGVYRTFDEATHAHAVLAARFPGWYLQPTTTGTSADARN